MRIRSYITFLLFFAIVGAFTLAGTLAWLLLRLQHAEANSGRESAEFQRVRTLVGRSNDLMRISDLLDADSPTALSMFDQLVSRCRDDLVALQAASMVERATMVEEVSTHFESLVAIASRIATDVEKPALPENMGEGDLTLNQVLLSAPTRAIAGEALLEEFDTASRRYFDTLEKLDLRMSADALGVEANLIERRQVTVLGMIGIGVVYLSFVVVVRAWITRRLVVPVQTLVDAGKRSMLAEEPFAIGGQAGPVEVKELSDTVASFVCSLEQKVDERTTSLSEQKQRLEMEVAERRKAEAASEELHTKLVDVSRRAGMAEVATGVLHNVGNVLNSVNTSAGEIERQMRAFRVAELAKIAQLLNDHEKSLENFLNSDRAKAIPAFLDELSRVQTDDQVAIIEEVQSLTQNIDHIKQIVGMQQRHARAGGVMEAVLLVDLIEDALRINAGELDRHGVEVIRQFRARPTVNTDRHQILQILINLISNAKQAVDSRSHGDRRVMVLVENGENLLADVHVIDNGVGIPKENLTRIFQHGFTTKEDGHGFGLHSSAIAAHDLGGNLTVTSDGPDMGATFTLSIPLHAAMEVEV